MGGQVFKALFFLTKLGFHMDDDFLDVLSDSEYSKESTFNWYESVYHEAVRSSEG